MNEKLPAPNIIPGEAWRDEPILPKQRALLDFLKLPVTPTRGGASNMIKSVFEGLAGNAHQKAWEVAKYKLHPDLYPPESKTNSAAKPQSASKSKSASLLGLLLKITLLLGFGFYAWQWFQSTEVESKLDTDSYLVPLQSTDGRTINAKILTLTKETVLIRREDGQTFDLPLKRLTLDSVQRIEEYRAAKRAKLMPK
jgi:hypothetical protein